LLINYFRLMAEHVTSRVGPWVTIHADLKAAAVPTVSVSAGLFGVGMSV
jgi:hypothetical protein